MSMPNKTTVNCPNCNAAFTTTVWSSVNTDLSDDLADKIISGEFFDAKCPECGFTAHMEYDVLYHDVKRSVMIWVIHTNTPDYEKKSAEIKSTRMLPGYKTRMVRDMNELREKVAALEAGRDDRVIEICKYFLKFEASQQYPEFETRNLFYTYADGKEIVFLYDINGKDMSCYLDPKLYDMMEERFAERLLAFKDNDYAIYDAQWAEEVFLQHLNEDFDDEIDNDDNNKEDQVTLFDALDDNNSSADNDEQIIDSTKKASCFDGNPYLILGVSCLDDRRKIISVAEEMNFLSDADECTEAQNILITPNKRLSAELDWFIETDISLINEIKTCLNNNSPIFIDNINALSKLNAMIYNCCISDETDSFSLGLEILDIDKQFGELNPTTLTEIINVCRRIAKMSEATESDVSIELSKKRERIRSIISEKLQLLKESDYIELVTLFAEKYIADDEYNDSGIISDIIDQYEIKFQTTIEEASEEIYAHVNRLKTLLDDAGIENNLTGLINRIEKWDHLVQPLQIKAMMSGLKHKTSQDVARVIRDLSLWLHNEKGLSELSLRLVRAMKAVFAETEDLSNLFETDINTLTNIISNNQTEKIMADEIDLLIKNANNLKNFASIISVGDFIKQVKETNNKAKNISSENELVVKIRENICYIARDVAIALHNDNQQTDLALKIAEMLLNEFGDLPELKMKLFEDVSLLKEQSERKKIILQQEQERKVAESSKRIGCLVFVGLFFLVWIISGLSQCSSSSSSNYSSYSSSSYSSSLPSVEKQFSQNLNSGAKVYANIVSIFPEMGIYTQGSSNYSSFVCKCKTSAGTTVWVHMSVSEYRSNFDSSASSSIYNEYAEEVTFSSSKKIRGTAKTSNSVLSGLSSDIGATMLIDFSSVN